MIDGQSTVGGATTGQAILGCITSKLSTLVLACFDDGNVTLKPSSALVTVFITAEESKLECGQCLGACGDCSHCKRTSEQTVGTMAGLLMAMRMYTHILVHLSYTHTHTHTRVHHVDSFPKGYTHIHVHAHTHTYFSLVI